MATYCAVDADERTNASRAYVQPAGGMAVTLISIHPEAIAASLSRLCAVTYTSELLYQSACTVNPAALVPAMGATQNPSPWGTAGVTSMRGPRAATALLLVAVALLSRSEVVPTYAESVKAAM